MNILFSFRAVKNFVFDIDGVLTDGGIYVAAPGQWIRRMDIKDGYAIQLAITSGFNVMIISGSDSQAVTSRLKNLGVQDIYMNVKDKKALLMTFAESHQWRWEETLYMGDDIPDYSCMELPLLSCCPADAAAEIKKISSYISPMKGGFGCVRDVIEKVLKLTNRWPLETTVAAT